MSKDKFGIFRIESVEETRAAIAKVLPNFDFDKLVRFMVDINKLSGTARHKHECCREFSILYEQLRTALGDDLNRCKFMSLPSQLGLSKDWDFNNISVFCHN
jgi:hypothetical protein